MFSEGKKLRFKLKTLASFVALFLDTFIPFYCCTSQSIQNELVTLDTVITKLFFVIAIKFKCTFSKLC